MTWRQDFAIGGTIHFKDKSTAEIVNHVEYPHGVTFQRGKIAVTMHPDKLREVASGVMHSLL